MDTANTAIIYDDDDEDAYEHEGDDVDVQLGFVDDLEGPILHQIGDWNEWDGGKVGGKPVRSI